MKSFFALLSLVQLAIASPRIRRWDDITERHSWLEVPSGWEYRSPAPKDYTFDLRISLKQKGIDDLISNLLEVSDPTHARYGQHLSKEEADALTAPQPDSLDAVESWLFYHGVNADNVIHRTGGGDFVTVRVKVDQAERMLGTTYNIYYHPKTSQEVVRTLAYSLPRELHSHVDVVTPTTYFSTLKTMRATSFLQPGAPTLSDSTSATSCDNAITPACLRKLYKFDNYVPKKAPGNTLGIAGFLDQFANYADLQMFFKQFRPDAAGSTFTTVQVNGGGNNQSDPGVEANLDIQYTTSISYPIPNVYYSTGGSPPFKSDSNTPNNTNEPFLDWLNFVLDQDFIPTVLSVSYGDDEQTVPPDYAVRVCNLLAQIGSRGTTVFVSSGDWGVGGSDCKTNDGQDRVIFQPTFPASCPYVTSVGGTTKSSPEVAANLSGGGFSRIFPSPSYQSSQVSSYLKSIGAQYAGLYNATGRGYPDLSAQAQNFQLVIGGKVRAADGTSASAPTVAAIFSLLNDYRMPTSQKSLGFINPLIYSKASAFNDVVSGNNPGCGTTGFTAKPGWDPVTGLGTPDFVKLQAL